MDTDKTLQEHQEICEKVYALLQEENVCLKREQKMPSTSLLDQKKTLLARLEKSVGALKAVNDGNQKLLSSQKKQIIKVQAQMMKIFSLDRENEQLLLKNSVHLNLGQTIRPVSLQKVEQAYKA
ncbi:MAG: hypothetical protein A2Y14_03625 [Verrucomicrobia bacterium GWF2_51_19]|nr:MAG: hypothetical protein A2Y14_03625 [Verrucomicrobia bacterium GWF2_51_19]HCJ12415.1 hypothetical protein [Opitutae bacterium]